MATRAKHDGQPGKTRAITFENRHAQTLSANLDMPVGRPPGAWAVFAHCFTCSKNLPAIRNISRALTAAGIGVLRFDFTGLGESEGEFAATNFTSNVSDLHDACAWLASNHGAPAMLIGHSLGGAAVIAAASEVESVRAVVTIAAPAHPEHVTAMFEGSAEQIEREGEATVELAGRPFKIRRQLLDDLARDGHDEKIERLQAALLIFHSPTDQTVGIDNARQIYEAARHPKSFITLDGADHLLKKAEDSRYVGSMIGAWAYRYLEQLEARNRPAPKGGDDQVVVRTGPSGFLTDIEASGHGLVADEPSEVGGTDAGPSPYDLLLSALGACTTMTLRMYADRKGWPLEAAEVRLEFGRLHANDCDDCMADAEGTPRRSEGGGKIEQITRKVGLEGELDHEQRARLMEIANKCPVHKTLTGDLRIETTQLDRS